MPTCYGDELWRGDIGEYPGDVIVLACEQCDRRGVYRKDRLVAEHGPNMKLPDLRHRLAADCPRVKSPIGNLGCGAVYPEFGSAVEAR